MTPMHAELTKLLDLQSKDLVLIEADQRLKAILDEIARLDGQIEAGRRDVTVAEKRLEGGGNKREELERRVESYRTIQDRRRERGREARRAPQRQAGVSA